MGWLVIDVPAHKGYAGGMIQRAGLLITSDELLAMGDRAWRKELVRGELVDMSPPSGPHGAIAFEVAFIVGQFVRDHRLGRCSAAETGFRLATEPDTVRAPDFAYVSRARLPGGKVPKGYFPGAPDLAVEVLSPSEPLGQLARKIDEYFVAGTVAVWVVDPETREVRVYTDPATSQVFTDHDELTGGEVLPGFACRVADIFA